MLNKELFGARLRTVRNQHQEAQAVPARLLGITVTQISDMENGKTGTTLERLVLLCEHYGVSADYLLGLKDTP